MSRQILQVATAKSNTLKQTTSCQSQSDTMKRSMKTEDDAPYIGRTDSKRKRAVGSNDAGASDSEFGMVTSFPMLSDEEPSLTTVQTSSPSSSLTPSASSSSLSTLSSSSSEFVTQSFHCVSKHLFALSDESRDRGSAKIASITVQLRHPALPSPSASSSSSSSSRSASGAFTYTSYFKIDGRKSFSNAPFKKYYRRGIHAAWFAEPMNAAPSTTVPTNGRVLMLISQRAGRANGKGFTGLKHEPASHSPKHPLLCLASNSVEYYVHVFINRSRESMPGEFTTLSDWTEVEVDVSAKFEAGTLTLDSVTLPTQTPAQIKQRPIVQVQRRLPQSPSSLPPLQLPLSRPVSTISTASNSSVSDVITPIDEEAAYSSDATTLDSPRTEQDQDESSGDEMDETEGQDGATASAVTPIQLDDSVAVYLNHPAGDMSDINLPESSGDELLGAEFQWNCEASLAHAFDEPKVKQEPMDSTSTWRARDFPTELPSFLSAEDNERAFAFLEERAAKRTKLGVSLFAPALAEASPSTMFAPHQQHHHEFPSSPQQQSLPITNEWQLASPRLTSLQAISPQFIAMQQHQSTIAICSPLADFPQAFSF